jgi:tetratricopeptide (TPR) repeat protein
LTLCLVLGLGATAYVWWRQGLQPDVEVLRANGMRAKHMGHYHVALRFFSEAIRLDPDNLQNYLDRGSVHAELGQHDQAIEDYRESLRRDPHHYWALIWKGTSHLARQEYDQAEQDFDRAMQLRPNEAPPYWGRGRVFSARGEHDQAVAEYNRSLELDSRPAATTYLDRGIALARLGRLEEALNDLNEAIGQDPQREEAFVARGQVFLDLGDLGSAFNDFSDAIRFDPRMADGYFGRAQVHLDEEDYAKAIADFSQAITLEPNEPIFWEDRGLAHKRAKQYGLAVADYQQALRLNPKSMAASFRLAWLQSTCQEEKYRNGVEALAHATRAYELVGGQDWNVIETLAAAHAAVGRFDEAVKWQEKALALADLPEDERRDGEERLRLYQDKKPYREK